MCKADGSGVGGVGCVKKDGSGVWGCGVCEGQTDLGCGVREGQPDQGCVGLGCRGILLWCGA